MHLLKGKNWGYKWQKLKCADSNWLYLVVKTKIIVLDALMEKYCLVFSCCKTEMVPKVVLMSQPKLFQLVTLKACQPPTVGLFIMFYIYAPVITDLIEKYCLVFSCCETEMVLEVGLMAQPQPNVNYFSLWHSISMIALPGSLQLLICSLCFIILLWYALVRTGLEGPGLTVAQKLWYCIANVGGQYIWARLQSFSAFRRWGDSEQVFLFNLINITRYSTHPHSTIIYGEKTRRLWYIFSCFSEATSTSSMDFNTTYRRNL